MDAGDLTIREAQSCQPWNVRYSDDFANAVDRGEGTAHLMGAHAVLHAAKTTGKLATVFESLDHSGGPITAAQVAQVAAMSADLITAALRLANLYGFDVASVLVERVDEKNGANLLESVGHLRRKLSAADPAAGERAALDAQMLRAEALVAARMEAAGQGNVGALRLLHPDATTALYGLVPAVRAYLLATEHKGG